ncbi:hypothetical protein D3C86_1794010 [compost metagenome]
MIQWSQCNCKCLAIAVAKEDEQLKKNLNLPGNNFCRAVGAGVDRDRQNARQDPQQRIGVVGLEDAAQA